MTRHSIDDIMAMISYAYMAGVRNQPQPPYDKPKEPYYLIVGAALDGAYRNGRNRRPFDGPRCAEWLDDLPSNIEDKTKLGQLYNMSGTVFDVYWDSKNDSITLEPT